MVEATVARVAYIDKLSNEVADQTGERPIDSVLADIFYPNMDPLLITELVIHRIGVGAVARPVPTTSYLELRDYVQKRSARERTLAPIPTKQMDVGSFAETTTTTTAPTTIRTTTRHPASVD